MREVSGPVVRVSLPRKKNAIFSLLAIRLPTIVAQVDADVVVGDVDEAADVARSNPPGHRDYCKSSYLKHTCSIFCKKLNSDKIPFVSTRIKEYLYYNCIQVLDTKLAQLNLIDVGIKVNVMLGSEGRYKQGKHLCHPKLRILSIC